MLGIVYGWSAEVEFEVGVVCMIWHVNILFSFFSRSRELSWFRIPTGLVDVSIDK